MIRETDVDDIEETGDVFIVSLADKDHYTGVTSTESLSLKHFVTNSEEFVTIIHLL